MGRGRGASANLLALLALLSTCTFGSLSAATPDPQRWRDEYIADPARKAILERYTTPMAEETQTALRSLTLAKLIATHCAGSALDPDIVQDYIRESGLGRRSPNDVELTAAVVNAEFSYFDLTRLKAVCAGAGRLFGDRGTLVPGLVSSGIGLPAWSEPKGEHWITVEPFLIPVDGRTRTLKGDAAPRHVAPPARRRPVVGPVPEGAVPRRIAL